MTFVEQFDKAWKRLGYPNRTKFVGDIIVMVLLAFIIIWLYTYKEICYDFFMFQYSCPCADFFKNMSNDIFTNTSNVITNISYIIR